MVRRHHAALLHCVIQQCQRGSRTVSAADLQTHFLQNPGNAVPHRGSRSKTQVHNSERHIQPLGCLYAHDLTHTGNAESSLFDGLRHHIEGLTLDALQCVIHHAGSGHTHIQHALRLTHTMERTGHEGVVLHSVGEYN